MILSIPTDRSGQTVWTKVRLLPKKEQSDQGLHCLPFRDQKSDQGLFAFLSAAFGPITVWLIYTVQILG